jgi:hypothetical protein
MLVKVETIPVILPRELIVYQPSDGDVWQCHLCSILMTLLLALTSPFTYAGPPFITDDPEPVEANHWEVNYSVSKTWRAGGSSAGAPSIDINYGLSPNIQLHAQPKYAYETDGQNKHSGLDNTEIGVKYRFINQQYGNVNWMLGTYPMVQLPTGSSTLGESRGKVQAFLPVWLQRNSDDWTIYGGIGYRLNQYADSKNSWFSGITTLYRFTNQLQLGGEVFHETSASIGERGASGFNMGGIYNVNNNYHLLFSMGKGLSNVGSTNQFSGYLALQVIY